VELTKRQVLQILRRALLSKKRSWSLHSTLNPWRVSTILPSQLSYTTNVSLTATTSLHQAQLSERRTIALAQL